MSEAALARREQFGIPLNTGDLPISDDYRRDLEGSGYAILSESRWLNAVLLKPTHGADAASLADRPYVREVVWAATRQEGGPESVHYLCDAVTEPEPRPWQGAVEALRQLNMLNGQFLHDNGYRGRGMTIAVLDAGFSRVDVMSAFEGIRSRNGIVGTIDLVERDGNVFSGAGHGTSVLSIMAADLPGVIRGTAPDADYLLIRTEDIDSEQLVEEFLYVAGLEYADQMGADIVNTSLGYTRFDHEDMDHVHGHLGSGRSMASRGAEIAAAAGMIVVNSAGNEGNKEWRFISIPSDGDSVLAVGSVDPAGQRSEFSGRGWEGIGAIKPDVMAMGESVVMINEHGEVSSGYGTSYATPLVAGLAACLWQAFPECSNMEILQAIRESSSQYRAPDMLNGYGIPDFQAACAILSLGGGADRLPGVVEVFPKTFDTGFTVLFPEDLEGTLTLELMDDSGRACYRWNHNAFGRGKADIRLQDGHELPSGPYVLKVNSGGTLSMFKMFKL